MMVPTGRGFAATVVAVILLVGSFAAPRGALAAPPTRIALVIGNSGYEIAPSLPNPANDARLMAATLRGLGFDVIERIDADRETTYIAIDELYDRLVAAGKDAIGLFYYAGHGVQVAGENYLIPLGADIRNERQVRFKAVSASHVLENMELAENGMNFVILDACRNNPFPASTRAATRGLARMNAPTGSLVAYSTGPGEVAADGVGGNSPYVLALSRAMRTPGVPAELMFKRVREQVLEATNDEQTPWEESSLKGGDFYFAGNPVQGAVETPTADASAGGKFDADKVFWQSIQGSGNPADFEAYIAEFGDQGIFARLASNRIKALNGEADATRSADATDATDQHMGAQDLLNAKQMFLELTENAESLMGSTDVPLIERLEKVRGMLGEVVDFEPMAKFVLGDHRNSMTPDQWKKFYLVYQELFLSGYSFTAASSWAGRYDIKGIRPYGPDTLVTVEFIDERGESLVVGARIRKKPDSFFGFKIVDFITQGLSLLVTQKGEYETTLIREGIDGLIRALEDKFGKVAEPIEIPG